MAATQRIVCGPTGPLDAHTELAGTRFMSRNILPSVQSFEAHNRRMLIDGPASDRQTNCVERKNCRIAFNIAWLGMECHRIKTSGKEGVSIRRHFSQSLLHRLRTRCAGDGFSVRGVCFARFSWWMFNPTFDHATGIRGRQICTRTQSLYTHGVLFVPTEQTAGMQEWQEDKQQVTKVPRFLPRVSLRKPVCVC